MSARLGDGFRSLVRFAAPLLVLTLLLAACGGSKPSAPISDSQTGGTAQNAATGQVSSKAGIAGATLPAAAAGSSAAPSAGALPVLDPQRLVVRNGELDLTVRSLGDAVGAVSRIATDAGGFIFSSSSAGGSGALSASITLQVPADRFDGVRTALRSLPGVVAVGRESVSSQDVTDEYVDLQSRQRNLQATEQQYLTLLAKATTINDTLAVEQQLSRVQGELEQVQGRIKFLDQRTSFSRLNVTLHAEVPATAAGPGDSLAGAVSRAWQRSLIFVSAVARAVVTVAVFFWWLWPVGAVAVYALRRRRSRALVAESRG